jgi:hypothetical protein
LAVLERCVFVGPKPAFFSYSWKIERRTFPVNS